MELKFRKNDGRKFSANLLLEKIGGVSLPYLHVKKDGKTYYLPMFKNIHKSQSCSLKIMYKGEKYSTLSGIESIQQIGVITLVDGKIHQSRDFNVGYMVFLNKAKRLALYDGNRGNHKKLMDINYDDVITLFHIPYQSGIITNLMTGATAYNHYSYRYLEFREE